MCAIKNLIDSPDIIVIIARLLTNTIMIVQMASISDPGGGFWLRTGVGGAAGWC